MFPEILPYSPPLIPAIVDFWNRTFARHPNAVVVSEELLKSRVFNKATDIERFDPYLYFVALHDGEVVGVIHGGVRPEIVCRAIWSHWPGGDQGYVAFIAVDERYRKKGIGKRLWDRLVKALGGVRRIDIDGQCVSPWYGNSEGPHTPMFGTPEGVSILSDDEDTHRFFAARGYMPMHDGVHLRWKGSADQIDLSKKRIADAGLEFELLKNHYPNLDQLMDGRERYPGGFASRVAVALEGRTVRGLVSAYPMELLGTDRWAIYEAHVSEVFHGRGIGSELARRLLHRLGAKGPIEVDVLTLSDVSGPAVKMYGALGFKEVHRWSIFGAPGPVRSG